MSDSHVADGIRYELLSEPTLADAIDCVSQVFPTSEPLASHLGISVEEFHRFAGIFLPDLMEDQLSWVAVDEYTDQVVGVRISEDYGVSRSPSMDGITPKFRPIFSLLADLDQQFERHQTKSATRYIHMFMVAVRNGYLEQGIAPTLYRCFFKDAQRRGYTHAVTEPTGAISQHILRDKFGFHVIHEIPYESWTYQSEPVFAGLGEHSHAMLMERALSELNLT